MKFLNTFSKCGLLVAFLMLLGNAALAQRAVKGKVTDADSGEPLIGASVSVVGTTRGRMSTAISSSTSRPVPRSCAVLTPVTRSKLSRWALPMWLISPSNPVLYSTKLS